MLFLVDISKYFLIVLMTLLLAACGAGSGGEQSDQSTASLRISLPGIEVRSRSARLNRISGVPAEVTSIIIEVFDAEKQPLAAEDILPDGEVLIEIPQGKNYLVRGTAFATDEILFLGEAAVDEVIGGSSLSVSLSLDEQVTLQVDGLADIEVGSTQQSVQFQLSGLKNTAIDWHVNDLEGGSAEYGTIDNNGRYTPPSTLPAQTQITVLAIPRVAPSFAQSFTFQLIAPTSNLAPNADAGVDISVNGLSTVNLSAAGSSDLDGSIVSYDWIWVSGDFNPALSNADTVSASFTAPVLQYGGNAIFRVTVTDDDGNSDSDEVTVSINASDQPLVANAGNDANVNEGEALTLDGSSSVDPDNAIVSYQWLELSASGVVFDDANSATPTFTAPLVSVDTTLQFRLTVSNDNGDQDSDTVSITVKDQPVMMSELLFAANDDFNDYDLWGTDSTEAGTQEILAVTLSNGDWSKYRTINGQLYFEGQQTATGRELWRSDGTAAGTELIQSAADSAYGSLGAGANANPMQFIALGDYLIYSAATSFDETFFYRDTLSFNTQTDNLVTLVSGSGLDSGNGAENFAGIFNGFAYFSVVNFSPVTTTLYRTDGSNPVETILTINGDARHTHDYIEFNGELYFGLGFNQLWKTNGTPAGTSLIKSFSGHFGTSSSFSGENNIVAFNNRLIFTADDGQGRELWVSDGTSAGTTLLLDLDSSPASTNPTEFHEVNGRVVFQSSAGNAATDGLWATDGTIAGTQRISTVEVAGDIFFYDGRGSAYAEVVESLGLMFFAGRSAAEIDLWVTDGTAAGTKRVIDLNIGNSDFPAMLRAGNNELLFAAEDGDFRAKLWRTDGTAAGTTLVKDINPAGFGNSAFFMPGG